MTDKPWRTQEESGCLGGRDRGRKDWGSGLTLPPACSCPLPPEPKVAGSHPGGGAPPFRLSKPLPHRRLDDLVRHHFAGENLVRKFASPAVWGQIGDTRAEKSRAPRPVARSN